MCETSIAGKFCDDHVFQSFIENLPMELQRSLMINKQPLVSNNQQTRSAFNRPLLLESWL